MRYFLKHVLLACLVLGLAFVLAIGWFIYQSWQKEGPLLRPLTIIIPRGQGIRPIAETLEANGVIRQAWVMVVMTIWQGNRQHLQAGEYQFAPHASMAEITTMLRKGEVVIHHLTIPEGLTSFQISQILNEAEALTGPPLTSLAEGTFLPNTYDYRYGDSRQSLTNRMAQAQTSLIQDLWRASSQGANPLYRLSSPVDFINLASLVEAEAKLDHERPLIAGVFLNRLRLGMRLQSDPTVIYALTKGQDSLGRLLSRKDLEFDSPYNSYRYAGLPPSPINNPGMASLQAVANPSREPYLYFVADGKGGHLFATNLEDHNRNNQLRKQTSNPKN